MTGILGSSGYNPLKCLRIVSMAARTVTATMRFGALATISFIASNVASSFIMLHNKRPQFNYLVTTRTNFPVSLSPKYYNIKYEVRG